MKYIVTYKSNGAYEYMFVSKAIEAFGDSDARKKASKIIEELQRCDATYSPYDFKLTSFSKHAVITAALFQEEDGVMRSVSLNLFPLRDYTLRAEPMGE